MAPAFEDNNSETLPPSFSSGNGDGVLHKSKVTVVGSGNWGSVASKLIASNTLRLSSFHGTYSFLSLSL